jgi:hypothetical protein
MTMLPSLMLRHMILAESLTAILALFVLQCYTSAFFTLFQVSNQPRTETLHGQRCEWFKLELGLGLILGCDSTSKLDFARVSRDH